MADATFTPTGLGQTIFSGKYTRTHDESWPEAARRVSKVVAAAEPNGKATTYDDRFYGQVVDGLFMPGGRTMYGAGRKVQQMLNCFVVGTKDSIPGWFKTLSDVGTISARGGGVGVNLSPIRPRGSHISGVGGEATGAVSVEELINGIGNVLMGGGGRRMALMLCLAINHPDIREKLDAKFVDPELPEEERRKQEARLKNANISVILPDDLPAEDFAAMVRNDEEIPLMFGGLPDERGRTISAKWLWDKIVTNAHQSGEPGVLNGHLANKMSNIWYHKPLISTNPCGEIWLEEYGCCCLGALVLPRFVVGGKFDWDKFAESIALGVRFLDDVLDVNHYPLPEIEENCQNVRRIGLGVMGLHSMLLDLGMKYTSEEGFAFAEEMFKFLRNTSYRASINLAIEKGAFPAFDPKFLDSGFAQTLPEDIRRDIREHGIRNCAILTIAPTGTTSMVQGVTGGLEPVYSPMYIRRHNVEIPETGKTEVVKTLVVSKEYTDHPELVEGALDIEPRDHLRMQVLAQKYIDNAVSKTINLANDYPVEELAELWLEFLPHMKGSTFYRSGSRFDEPMEYIEVGELSNVMLDWDGAVEYEDPESMECPSGACEVVLPGAQG